MRHIHRLLCCASIVTMTFTLAAEGQNKPLLKSTRAESEAIRKSAGLEIDPALCNSRIKYKVDRYRCPVPESSRDNLRTALIEGGWQRTTIPSYALFAFQKGTRAAYFVCDWQTKACELQVERITN